MNTLIDPEKLLGMINAYRQCRAILTAAELGVWRMLDDGPQTSAILAERLGTDSRATDRLLNALCSLDLLEKAEGRFSHSETSARFLTPSSEEYFHNLGHSVNLWEHWSHLTEAVRLGTAPVHTAVRERGEKWLENFIAAMHHRARIQAPEDVNLIDLHDAGSVLDLGGGSGAYAMAMVRVKQDLRAVVFALTEVIPITRRYIEQAGLPHRIDTMAGDYTADSIGTGYDVVFLSAIVHSNTPSENAALLRKCADALNPGGQLIVQDFIVDEDRIHPASAAMFALNMLVATAAGETYTEMEVADWMLRAGLEDIDRRDTKFAATQIRGRKPILLS